MNNAIIRPANRTHGPRSFELTIAPTHGGQTSTNFFRSLREAVSAARANPTVEKVFARPAHGCGVFTWHTISKT